MIESLTLSTGKHLTFIKELNGSHTIEQVLTHAEWEEYCAVMIARARESVGHRFVSGYTVQHH